MKLALLICSIINLVACTILLIVEVHALIEVNKEIEGISWWKKDE